MVMSLDVFHSMNVTKPRFGVGFQPNVVNVSTGVISNQTYTMSLGGGSPTINTSGSIDLFTGVDVDFRFNSLAQTCVVLTYFSQDVCFNTFRIKRNSLVSTPHFFTVQGVNASLVAQPVFFTSANNPLESNNLIEFLTTNTIAYRGYRLAFDTTGRSSAIGFNRMEFEFV